MFRKTAITLGLVMVAGTGTGIAAQNSAGMGGDGSMDSGMSGSNASSDQALMTQFKALDTNGDDVISRSEATRNPQLARMYESFDTSATIEGKDKGRSDGLTFDQFQAGMQAESSSSGGVVGPAVSGGGTYTLMDDGSRRLDSDSSSMSQPASDSMGQQMNQKMDRGMSNMQDKANDSMPSTQKKPERLPRSLDEGRTGQPMDQSMDKNGAMRDEMKAQGSDDYGDTGAMESGSSSAPMNSSGSTDSSSSMGGQLNEPETGDVESNY